MAEGGDREAIKFVFSRPLFSPYVTCLRSKIRPVTYPKYTTLNLGLHYNLY